MLGKERTTNKFVVYDRKETAPGDHNSTYIQLDIVFENYQLYDIIF